MFKKAKQATDKYYKPTPKKWRKIGDALQDVGIIVGSITVFTVPWVGVLSIALGRIGKIITNFASE